MKIKNSKDGFNILTNNNGFLKTMVDVQVKNTFNLASSMYIGQERLLTLFSTKLYNRTIKKTKR